MEESETTEASETAESTESTGSKRGERINRAIKRARKAAGPDFDENQDQVKFMLEEARILATLEVADALRGNQDDDEA
jgi:hypothetical protein